LNIKRVLNILIFFSLLLSTSAVQSAQSNDVEAQQKRMQEKIKRVNWLENVEKGKLYKNQQRLEDAQITLKQSEDKIDSARKELFGMQSQLNQATAEYNSLNRVLATNIRKVFKTQRKAFFELLITSEDINMLVDRIYFQKLILRDDYNRMSLAKRKAQEIALMKYNIEARKRNYERSVALANTQKEYIQKAIAKNESMINKLRTDRAAYQKAERELAWQSKSLGSYINRNAKDTSTNVVASGFMKPIQGRITSPFGWRTHPIFNTRTFHSGVDIGGPNYGEIKASNSGKVIYTGWYGGYGKVVIIEHGVVRGKPVSTLYAHMSTIKAVNGQQVTKGQVIGYEGTTGYSTGPHCHFEVRENGKPSNPTSYVSL
jgi:murein DD-endopeptidase MepM/ murein hydrolase activator NlpD